MMLCSRHEKVHVAENLCMCKGDYIPCYKCHLEAYHLKRFNDEPNRDDSKKITGGGVSSISKAVETMQPIL